MNLVRLNMLRRMDRRTSAFFVKELVVAFGQPRLILSLVIGPFLLLFLFGLGFSGARDPFDVVLVVPDRPAVPVERGVYRDFFLWSLHLVDVTADEDSAMTRLQERDVDAVVVAPANPLRDLAEDRAATFVVYFNHLDPLDRSRLNGLAFGHTRELNALLVAAVLDGLLEASGVQEANNSSVDAVRDRLLAGDSEGALGILDRLLAAVVILRLSGEAAYTVANTERTSPPTSPQLDRFELLLRAVRAEIAPEQSLTAEQEARLGELERTAALLPDVVRAAANVSAERLAAPVDYRLENIAPSEISYIRYYAPVVLVLLVQHIGVTLAALSTIRERTRGTTELFAVAPVRLTEIIFGKALSYGLLLVGISTVLLLVSIVLLDVPMRGNILLAALVLSLMTAAALAIGFILAAVSTTEAQTVQLALLTLLFAVFFGGLFVPAVSLDPPVRLITFGVPVTHAGDALRTVMLRGDITPIAPIAALGLMDALLVPVAVILLRHSYRMD